jgi:hypothetical protein
MRFPGSLCRLVNAYNRFQFIFPEIIGGENIRRHLLSLPRHEPYVLRHLLSTFEPDKGSYLPLSGVVQVDP